MIAVILAGLLNHVGGFEHRYLFVDGFAYNAATRSEWEKARAAHECLSVEVKRYEHERVVVHLCIVG